MGVLDKLYRGDKHKKIENPPKNENGSMHPLLGGSLSFCGNHLKSSTRTCTWRGRSAGPGGWSGSYKTACSIDDLLKCQEEINQAMSDCGHLDTLVEITTCINDILTGLPDCQRCVCDALPQLCGI